MSGPSHVPNNPSSVARNSSTTRGRREGRRGQWRIGTEHEKFGFRLDDLRPPTFEGERGIGALLEGMTRFGWERGARSTATPIALTRGKRVGHAGAGRAAGAVRRAAGNHPRHLLRSDRAPEGSARPSPTNSALGFLGMGFQPKWRRDDMPWMPKGRYEIMRDYMPKVGSLGLDMMTRTCTVQVNLDFANEADMVKKFRVVARAAADRDRAVRRFAVHRRQAERLSRATARTSGPTPIPDRTGMLDFVFEDGFGFERYVDYLLDVPMYFSYRNGEYIDLAGKSFRDFLAGKLPELPGATPTLKDWADHMTTAFPEVRLKQYLEMRGADGGPWNRLCALPAFWVGLLYDRRALDAAWDLVKDFTRAERHALRDGVPKHALKLPFRGGTVRDLARRGAEDRRARPASAARGSTATAPTKASSSTR